MGIQQFNGLLRAQGQIAPDPADSNVIHVVYNDLETVPPPGEHDVNVFYRKLHSVGGNWTLDDRVRVNTNIDTGGNVTDQFRPVIVATPPSPVAGGLTNLHVLFYDDRDYPTQSDLIENAKMNMYYSYSTDGGSLWQPNQRIYLKSANPGDPPVLDYSVPLHPEFQLGEYNGIALRQADPSTWEIWSSFGQMLPLGSSGEDDFSQIGAVRIPVNQ